MTEVIIMFLEPSLMFKRKTAIYDLDQIKSKF